MARDLGVAEAARRDEVLSTQILDHRMVRVVTRWGPFEGLALELEFRSENFLPRIGFVDDPISDFLEDRRLRMPHSGMDAALAGLEVEEVTRRHVLRRFRLVVPEMDPDVGLVRALVRREPNISINPGDRSAEGLRLADEMWTHRLQSRSCVANEADCRPQHDRFEPSFVRLEPVLSVVLPESSEEIEELRREVLAALPHVPDLLKFLRILNWGSAVEHWREGAGIEDCSDRADPVSPDPVPLADEGGACWGVRHHVVEEADVISVDEGLLRLHPFDDVVEFPEGLEVWLRSMERFERPDEREVVMKILPRSRHVALSECFLVRRHNVLCIRHIQSRSVGSAAASCHAAKIGPPGIRNQKNLPMPGISTRGRTMAPPARSIFREAASRSSTRT